MATDVELALGRPIRELTAIFNDKSAEIERLQRDGVEAARRAIAVDEALRELLSYCKDQADIYGKQFDDDRAASYDDVAAKLADLLDGEN